jgi:hypothetical protein
MNAQTARMEQVGMKKRPLLGARLILRNGNRCKECGCDMICYLEGKYAGKKICTNFCQITQDNTPSLRLPLLDFSALKSLFERASEHKVVLLDFGDSDL